MKDPIICTSCRDSLYTHNDFLNTCAELQAKVGDICDSPVLENRMNPQFPNLYIKTESLEEFEGNEMEISDTYLTDYAERKEKIDEVEMPFKAEFMEIKAEEDEEER